MTDKLYIDFETRSALDLKRYGLWRYSHDPSTSVWCMGFAFNDDAPRLIYFHEGLLRPEREDDVRLVLDHVRSGGLVVAHNAPFEYAIWEDVLRPRFDFPELKPEQLVDTLARAYAMGLPGSLEAAAGALGLNVRKDDTGRQLMLRMCKPVNMKRLAEGKDTEPKWITNLKEFTFLGEKRTPIWALKRLGEYCKVDVEVERGIYKRTVGLSAMEQRVWLAEQHTNRRGIYFDREAVQAALKIRDRAVEQFNEEISQVTSGDVQATTNVGALKDWCADYGLFVDSLAKDKLEALLQEDLPAEIRRALELRQEANRATSVAKLDAVRRLAGEDGRVRYLFQYHGAHTGRFAGRGVQIHNLPRDLPGPAEVREIIARIKAGEYEFLEAMYGSPLTVISQILRGFIKAQDGVLIGGDWSNIEGRGLAWLAGEEWKLRAFKRFDAGVGPDIYTQSYATIFGKSPEEVTKDERQVGKVVELSMGYQGGRGAFHVMGRTYGVDVDDETAEKIKHAWRQAHPRIKGYWYDLEEAAIKAVRNPGEVFAAGAPGRRVKYKKAGSFLCCQLPSNRVMFYPYPQIHTDEWGPKLTYKTVPSAEVYASGRVIPDKANTRQWARVGTYGGKLAENCIAEGTQVLTDKGWKAIERVGTADRIWDGRAWVQHEGLKYQGEQVTIVVDGVRLTPEHRVLTTRGWVHASQSKRSDGFPCGLPDGFRVHGGRWSEKLLALFLRVRSACRESRLRACQVEKEGSGSILRLQAERDHRPQETHSRKNRAQTVCGLALHAGSVSLALASSLAQLWREGRLCLSTMGALFRELLGRYAAFLPERVDSGAAGQQRRLYPRELLLGGSSGAGQQQAKQPTGPDSLGRNDSFASQSPVRHRRDHATLSSGARLACQQAVSETRCQESRVYDILNCGPRRRFVVKGETEPFIVHNCTQAVCRDILAEAYVALEERGYPVVKHVHDEIVVEGDFKERDREVVETVMQTPPPWAEGFPLAAECWLDTRYRKE